MSRTGEIIPTDNVQVIKMYDQSIVLYGVKFAYVDESGVITIELDGKKKIEPLYDIQESL